jgi:hypothetical protein
MLVGVKMVGVVPTNADAVFVEIAPPAIVIEPAVIAAEV